MAFDLSKFILFNPFAKFFKDSRPEEEAKEQTEVQNSQGISQEEIDLRHFVNYDYLAQPGASITYIGIQFEQYFGSKAGRIQKYRQMSRYPIINDALDNICDDAIVGNPDGNICTLDILEEIPEHIEAEIRKNWNYLITNVFRFNERGWEFFRKWITEAELYVELVLNDAGDNIIGVKVLPAYSMIPIYEQNKIKGYMQVVAPGVAVGPQGASLDGPGAGAAGVDHANQGNVSYSNTENYSQGSLPNSIIFDKNQIAYTNFGDYGDGMLDVRGFLENAIRPFNQLKNMEDALVVYRLVRAPQRRVWNIYTGRMPKGKADEYIKQLANRYKKKIIYDSETGAMNSSQNVQGLTEDFWFARDINGNGTSVETIGGDSNFGEMDDIKYFQENLYKTLKLPRARYDDTSNGQYMTGKSGEITREEIKFARFIERLQRRFKYILLEPFITLLRLRGIDERYIDLNMYNIMFTKSNLFKEYKELELLESRISVFSSIAEYIYDKDDNPKGTFAKEFAMRRFFLMDDSEFLWNKQLMEKEVGVKAEDIPKAGGEEGGFGGEGEGAGFGGEGEGAGMGGAEGLGPEAAPTETTPTPEAETVPTTPESVTFDINNINTAILKEWQHIDKHIRSKHNKRKLSHNS
jgi:hypothetical protein